MKLKKILIIILIIWLISPIPELTIIFSLIFGEIAFFSWKLKFYLLVVMITVFEIVSFYLKNKILKGKTIKIKINEDKGIIERIKEWI